MGWFSPDRDPDDPRQLQIAVHELAHAHAWTDGGLIVRGVAHYGRNGGNCPVRYWPGRNGQALAFAVGCWAGFEAEDRWLRHHGLGSASRANSAHDIRLFRQAVREIREVDGRRLSEGEARSLARTAVARRWQRITRTAPRLVTAGRLSPGQL